MLQDNLTDRSDQALATSTDRQWLEVLDAAVEHRLVQKDAAGTIKAQALVMLVEGKDLADGVRELLAKGRAAPAALELLAPFYEPGDVIELRAVDPAGGAESLCGKLDDTAQRKALEDFVRRWNGLSNLYVGINPRRDDMAGTGGAAKAHDIVARRVMVLDLDFKDAPAGDLKWEKTIAGLRGKGLVCFALASGNGVHVWTRLEGLDTPEAAKDVTQDLKGAMKGLGADDMSDLPRIIRLPFTVNIPTASKQKRGATLKLAAPYTECST